MHRSKWRQFTDWLRNYRPVHYRTEAGDWWSYRGKYYRVRTGKESE